MRIAIVSCMLLFSLVACSTFNSETPLTAKEQFALVSFARNVVLQNPNLQLTQEEIDSVRVTDPKVDIKYSGYKSGIYSISWEFKRLTISCLGNGDLTNPSKSFTGITTISVSK